MWNIFLSCISLFRTNSLRMHFEKQKGVVCALCALGLFLLSGFLGPLLLFLIDACCRACALTIVYEDRVIYSRIFTIFIGFFLLFMWSYKTFRHVIWGTVSFQLFVKGCRYALCLYPVILITTQIVHVCVLAFVSFTQTEQVAIQVLRNSSSSPLLSAILNIQVMSVIPIEEEILFRGFFQNSLANFFKERTTLILTSLLFACFHLDIRQGYTNIELFIGLFLFSYCMGNAYMKERSLLVPIGMHMTFNTVSLIVMHSR